MGYSKIERKIGPPTMPGLLWGGGVLGEGKRGETSSKKLLAEIDCDVA